jgi:copper chaperone
MQRFTADTHTGYEGLREVDPELGRVYRVVGMTCSHCEAAVVDEVGALRGVTSVDVDLGSGRLTVHGERVEDDAVAAAVAEAGYAVRR